MTVRASTAADQAWLLGEEPAAVFRDEGRLRRLGFHFERGLVGVFAHQLTSSYFYGRWPRPDQKHAIRRNSEIASSRPAPRTNPSTSIPHIVEMLANSTEKPTERPKTNVMIRDHRTVSVLQAAVTAQ